VYFSSVKFLSSHILANRTAARNVIGYSGTIRAERDVTHDLRTHRT